MKHVTDYDASVYFKQTLMEHCPAVLFHQTALGQ